MSFLLEIIHFDYRPLVQDFLSTSLIILAFIWGGGPERAAAATWLIAFELLGFLDSALTGSGSLLTEVDFFLALKDVVAGAMWIAIALYANRNYTLWIAGLQIIAMSAHLVRGVVETISPIGYSVMYIAPGWFQLLLLGIGIFRHVRRKKRYGPYRDWRIVRLAPPGSWLGRFQRRLVAILGYDFFAKKEQA